jgi:hypothetical protein
LVFGQAHDGGIRGILWFLELSGFDRFIAASYGSQQKFAQELERLLVQFGTEEDRRLAQQMAPREITVCEDETFHPQICLVAIEPVSNYLILEEYVEHRDAATWSETLKEALQPFTVTVIQCVSDQARALIVHAETELGVHHGPDLFHVQYETSQATSLALNRQSQQAYDQLQKTLTAAISHESQLETLCQRCRDDNGEVELVQKSFDLQHEVTQAQARLMQCQERQRRARSARQGISRHYHPFDIETGAPRTAADVRRLLTEQFDTLDEVAAEAQLSTRARERLTKARRVLNALVATITFFWTLVELRQKRLNCSPEVANIWRDVVVASYYLTLSAGRASHAAERRRLRSLAETIYARARDPTSPWAVLPSVQRQALEYEAREVAEIFQRSSSCVEGRNGQLALRHHGLRELTTRKLQALRVLHNYASKRADKTTSAERFFRQTPRELFPWLLERLPLPARPR